MKKIFSEKNLATSIFELITVVFISLVLLSVALSYSKQSLKIVLLNRDIIRFASDLTRAKNLSLALLKKESGTENICAWGIYIPTPPTSEYYLFADMADNCENSDKKWALSETKEIIRLEQGIKIVLTNFQEILFWPPDPTVYFRPSRDKGVIVVSDGRYSKTIEINKLGQINFR